MPVMRIRRKALSLQQYSHKEAQCSNCCSGAAANTQNCGYTAWTVGRDGAYRYCYESARVVRYLTHTHAHTANHTFGVSYVFVRDDMERERGIDTVDTVCIVAKIRSAKTNEEEEPPMKRTEDVTCSLTEELVPIGTPNVRRFSRIKEEVDKKYQLLIGKSQDGSGLTGKEDVADSIGRLLRRCCCCCNYKNRNAKAKKDQGMTWVHNGHGNINIFLDREGTHICLDDLVHIRMSLLSSIATAKRDDFHVLDLGTARGGFLFHLNKTFHLPFESLCGASAVDQRDHHEKKIAEDRIPDESYVVCNLDKLRGVPKISSRVFDFIWSRATFYHFVDPFEALCAVYDLLRPSKVGSIAMIRDVPLAMSLGKDDETATALSKRMTRALRSKGYEICINEMPEKPGFFDVAMKRVQTSPPHLILPLAYTRTLHRFGGASGYAYAGVRPLLVTGKKVDDDRRHSESRLSMSDFVERSLGCSLKDLGIGVYKADRG